MKSRHQILTDLAAGRMSVAEAERLLDQVRSAGSTLRVVLTPRQVSVQPTNMKLPISLIKVGLRFGGFIPGNVRQKIEHELRDKGIEIDFSRLDEPTVDRMAAALTQAPIEIDDERGHARIWCE